MGWLEDFFSMSSMRKINTFNMCHMITFHRTQPFVLLAHANC